MQLAEIVGCAELAQRQHDAILHVFGERWHTKHHHPTLSWCACPRRHVVRWHNILDGEVGTSTSADLPVGRMANPSALASCGLARGPRLPGRIANPSYIATATPSHDLQMLRVSTGNGRQRNAAIKSHKATVVFHREGKEVEIGEVTRTENLIEAKTVGIAERY